MRCGSLSQAISYEKIEDWVQDFLRNDGDNLVLADGLLKEERNYIGPVQFEVSKIDIEKGAPSYLTKPNDIEWFYQVVDQMKESYVNWDMPPLIVNYTNGQYEVNDGRHRLEMLRQLGEKYTMVVFWTTGEKDYEELKHLLNIK